MLARDSEAQHAVGAENELPDISEYSRGQAGYFGIYSVRPTAPRERLSARPRGRMSATELFGQLFPDGVQMTAELLADLELWERLTSKLAARDGTAP